MKTSNVDPDTFDAVVEVLKEFASLTITGGNIEAGNASGIYIGNKVTKVCTISGGVISNSAAERPTIDMAQYYGGSTTILNMTNGTVRNDAGGPAVCYGERNFQ